MRALSAAHGAIIPEWLCGARWDSFRKAVDTSQTKASCGAAMVGEDGRIRFLLQRDGLEATVAWVWRTLRIYRAAVLNNNHHASSDGFRRGFIESYCDFKRWLARMHAGRSSDGPS